MLPIASRQRLMAAPATTPSTFVHRLRATCPPHTKIASVRNSRKLHTTIRSAYPRKDSQDKDSLNPTSSEYSQSGGDDAVARTEKTAFDPDQTSPEQQGKSAEEESGGAGDNPLKVSPADKLSSKARDPQEGGAEASPGESGGSQSERQRTSSGGSPNKAGGTTTG